MRSSLTTLLFTPLSLASLLTETKQPWTQGCHPHSCLPSTKAWNSPTTDSAPWTSYSSYLPPRSSYPTSHHHYTVAAEEAKREADAQLIVPTITAVPEKSVNGPGDPPKSNSWPMVCKGGCRSIPTTFQTKTSSTFHCDDANDCQLKPTTSCTTTRSVSKDFCDDGSCLFTSTNTHIDLATMTVPHGYEGPCGPDGQWSCWFPYEPECTGHNQHCKATAVESTARATATAS